MDGDVKQKWLTALQSGTYQKGKNRLRTLDDKFCCLGVLCDLMNPKGWHKDCNGYTHEDKTAYISMKVRDSVYLDFDYMHKLADINDETETFKEVIEYIEEKL